MVAQSKEYEFESGCVFLDEVEVVGRSLLGGLRRRLE